MKARKMVLVGIALLFVFSVGFVSQPTKAADAVKQDTGSSDQCTGLDVVLAVDQSSSNYINPGTDIPSYRTIAAQNILQRLALNALVDCPNATHRFGLLNFGNNANWVSFQPSSDQGLDWIAIGGFGSYKSDTKSWTTKWLNPLINNIKPIIKDNGEVTNVPAALQAAYKMLNGLGTISDGLPRTKAVILITDGLPNTSTETQNTNTQIKPIYEALTQFKDIQLWLVALKNVSSAYLSFPVDDPQNISTWASQTAPSAPNWMKDILDEQSKLAAQPNPLARPQITLGTFWANETSTHNGEMVILSQNAQEIPASLSIIYEKLIQHPGFAPTCNSPFYINAYVQSADFTYTKNNENIDINLEYLGPGNSQENQSPVYQFSDGKVIDSSGKTIEDFSQTNGGLGVDGKPAQIKVWFTVGALEQYVLNNPPAGTWMWTVPSDQCPDSKVRYLPLNATAQFISPSGNIPPVRKPPFYDKNNPSKFEVKVAQQDGTPLLTDPNYPLNVTLEYIGPDGQLIMDPSGSPDWQLSSAGDTEPGIWRSQDPVVFPQLGKYSVQVKGTTLSSDPSITAPIVVFQETLNNVFNVPDVQPFGFKILTPEDKGTIPLNTFKNDQKVAAPIDVRIQMVDADGNPISNPGGIVRGNTPFTATLIDQQNAEIQSVPLTLSADPADAQKSIYEGMLRSDKSSSLDPEGNYKIRVEVTGDWDIGKWLPTQLKRTIDITRTSRDETNLLLMKPKNQVNLYANLIMAWSLINRPQPVKIEVQLQDANKQYLAYDRVLDPSAKVGDLLQGTLDLPEPLQANGKPVDEPLTFSVENDPVSPGQKLFVAQAAQSVDLIGEYTIHVHVNQAALATNYVIPENELDSKFDRTTPFFNSPSTANTLAIILAILLAGFIIFLIWLFFGPLSGEFTFAEQVGDRYEDIGTVRARGVINRRWVRTAGWTDATLRKMSLGRMRVYPWIEYMDDDDRSYNDDDTPAPVRKKKEYQGVIIETINRRGELLLNPTQLHDRDKADFKLDDGRNIQVEYRE